MNKPQRPHTAQKHGQKSSRGQSQKNGQSPKRGQSPKNDQPTKSGQAPKGEHKQRPAPFKPGQADKRPHRKSSPADFTGQERGRARVQAPEETFGPREHRDHNAPHNTPYGVSHDSFHNSSGDSYNDPLYDEESTQIPFLPGVKPVLEMLIASPERIDTVFIRKGRHGKEMDEILDHCRQAGVRFSLLEPSAFAKQLGQAHTQGVVARLFESGFTPFETLLDTIMDAPLPLLVALDQVQDPGNAGTLARTLYALGGAGLVIPRHNSVYLGAGAARAAAGALQKLPVAKVGSLSQAVDSARKMGITIYGAAAGGDGFVPVTDLFTLTPRFPALLLLGSEEKGIRPTLAKRCHSLVSIPMQRDFDSLNVAQAGAICIASFLRRHLSKG